MHDEQVLIDGVEIILVQDLDQVYVGVQVLDTELLVRVLVLLHEDPILDLLVPHRLLKVPGQHDRPHKQDEVLQCHEQEQEYDESCGVWASEKSLDSDQLLILKHRDHAEKEENVVAEGENEHDIADASRSEDVDHGQADGVEDQV